MYYQPCIVKYILYILNNGNKNNKINILYVYEIKV